MNSILAHEGIERQQRTCAESMLVAGRKVESHHLLTLVLVELVEGIRNLEPVARQEDVGVERVPRTQIDIETIEDVPAVADSMDRTKFRCVQKASRSQPV